NRQSRPNGLGTTAQFNSQAQYSQGQQGQKRIPGACDKCGLQGHVWRQCPQQPKQAYTTSYQDPYVQQQQQQPTTQQQVQQYSQQQQQQSVAQVTPAMPQVPGDKFLNLMNAGRAPTKEDPLKGIYN